MNKIWDRIHNRILEKFSIIISYFHVFRFSVHLPKKRSYINNTAHCRARFYSRACIFEPGSLVLLLFILFSFFFCDQKLRPSTYPKCWSVSRGSVPFYILESTTVACRLSIFFPSSPSTLRTQKPISRYTRKAPT